MRKYLLTFLTFGLMFILSGCQDMKIEKTLDGTIWDAIEEYRTNTIKFDDSYCEMVINDDGVISKHFFSYEYDFPVVLMYPEDDEIAMLKGIINKDKTKMNLVNLSNNKTIGILIKR